MEKNLGWLRYLAPLVGIIFCPVTILLAWAIWSSPIDGETSPYKKEVGRVGSINLLIS